MCSPAPESRSPCPGDMAPPGKPSIASGSFFAHDFGGRHCAGSEQATASQRLVRMGWLSPFHSCRQMLLSPEATFPFLFLQPVVELGRLFFFFFLLFLWELTYAFFFIMSALPSTLTPGLGHRSTVGCM